MILHSHRLLINYCGQNQFVYGQTAARKGVQIVFGGVEMEDR